MLRLSNFAYSDADLKLIRFCLLAVVKGKQVAVAKIYQLMYTDRSLLFQQMVYANLLSSLENG